MRRVAPIRNGLIRTNPVWCLGQRAGEMWNARDPVDVQRRLAAIAYHWAQDGIYLPPSALEDFFYLLPPASIKLEQHERPKPGVVGLVVNRDDRTGFVTPLKVARSEQWWVGPWLPFRSGHVQDAITELFNASGRSLEDRLPEVLAFHINDELQQRSEGSSMDIAALLGVVDTMNAYGATVFRCACAVVQPGSSPYFESVHSVREKLQAFIREYDRGSLLVRTPDSSEAAEFDKCFDDVWIVNDFDALAHSLDEYGLLDELLKAHPLTPAELDTAKQRLRWLMDDQRNLEALDFAQRISKCGTDLSVPTRRYLEVESRIEDLYRHLGKYQAALDASSRVVGRLAQLREATCYQDRLDADVRLAAALYDAHDFNRMSELLEPWNRELARDPQRVSPESRVMLFNTLARALIILEGDGWRDLLCQSIRLQEQIERGNVPRTRNYLIYGLLRHGDLNEAEREIAKAKRSERLDAMSLLFLTFFRADLARRRGEIWPQSEADSPARRQGHAYAFYIQATARQAGRSKQDSATRFRTARTAFSEEVHEDDAWNVQRFLAATMKLAEAAMTDRLSIWDEAADEIKSYLKGPHPNSFLAFYNPLVSNLRKSPSLPDVEALLTHVPFL